LFFDIPDHGIVLGHPERSLPFALVAKVFFVDHVVPQGHDGLVGLAGGSLARGPNTLISQASGAHKPASDLTRLHMASNAAR
jgi:hypothetical protein